MACVTSTLLATALAAAVASAAAAASDAGEMGAAPGSARIATAVTSHTDSLSAFDHLMADWKALQGYSMTIESHEVLGDRVSDHELRYTFTKPHHAQLDVVTGNKSGSTMVWDGGPTASAYKRGLLSFVKIRGGVYDADLTSLRGNGVLSPDMGDLIACFNAYRSRLQERSGPAIGGQPTDVVSLPYAGVSCPDDSTTDKAVTRDAIYISRSTGLILRQKRYVGAKLVERFDLTDYKIVDSPTASS